ncbi:TetR/AcrR family transcriptional regulator [Novosphingobium sp. BL-8H]|uniref:TetR/AcrR family transcriptional regulator n=1 Tax=Novosphingobium sp. BL-8H TaxID=3127640 RepID=UPI003757083A
MTNHSGNSPLRRAKAPAKGRAGRPTAARAAEIDQVILKAARELFLEVGADVASMDAVAAAAGVSKGTLYTRFTSKDALIAAVIDKLLEQMDTRASAKNHLLPSELEPRLKEYARRLVDVFSWTDYHHLDRLMATASRINPDLKHRWDRMALAGYVKTLADEMERAAGMQGQPGVDWHSLAQLFVYGVSGRYLDAVGKEDFIQTEFEVYCSTVVDAIVAYVDRRRMGGREPGVADLADDR